MVMSRGAIASVATGICLALSFPSAAATSREQTEEIFGEILAIADDKLSVLINDSEQPDVKLGEKFSFQFAGGRDGYLTVLYVDAHGNAVLLFPTDTPDDARVEPGKTLTYPLASAGHELVAVHPVGLETVFAVATPRPISSADLGMKASPIGIPVDSGLTDPDPKLEKFAVDARCAPQRVSPRHAPDQCPDLPRDWRAASSPWT